MAEKICIEIFTDPFCSWCWGSEPELRALESLYGDNLTIKIRMGALVPDIREAEDIYHAQERGFAYANSKMVRYWPKPAAETQMPMEAAGFSLFSEDHPSGFPINIAYKAAELSADTHTAHAYLRRLREGIFVDSALVNRPEVQVALASELGLDGERFKHQLDSGMAEKAFWDDVERGEALQIDLYPTYIINYRGESERLKGYILYEQLDSAIQRLSHGKIKASPLEQTPEALVKLLDKYPRLAPAEIRRLFGFETVADAAVWGKELADIGIVALKNAGDRFLVEKP